MEDMKEVHRLYLRAWKDEAQCKGNFWVLMISRINKEQECDTTQAKYGYFEELGTEWCHTFER